MGMDIILEEEIRYGFIMLTNTTQGMKRRCSRSALLSSVESDFTNSGSVISWVYHVAVSGHLSRSEM